MTLCVDQQSFRRSAKHSSRDREGAVPGDDRRPLPHGRGSLWRLRYSLLLTLICSVVGCGTNANTDPAAEAAQAQANARAEAAEKEFQQRLQKYSDESMKSLPAAELRAMIIRELQELAKLIALRQSNGQPLHRESQLQQRVLAGIRLLPADDRAAVWKERHQEIRRMLEDDERCHQLLHLENQQLDAPHLEHLLTTARDAANARPLGIPGIDDIADAKRKLDSALRALAEAAPCPEAAPEFAAILRRHNLRLDDTAQSENATRALDYLRRLDTADSRAVIKGLLDSSDSIPRPMAAFLPVAIDLEGADRVSKKLQNLVTANRELLDAIYYLQAAKQQIQGDRGSAPNKESNEARDIKTKSMEALIATYPASMARLLTPAPGEIVVSISIGGTDKGRDLSSVDLQAADIETRIQAFDELVYPKIGIGRSEHSRSENWEAQASAQLIEFINAIHEVQFDGLLAILFEGLNVKHEKVSVAATQRLTELLPPEEFPMRFFEFLTTRDQYSVAEVDRYVAFLRNHCAKHSQAVADALDSQVKDVAGQLKEISWIKKVIGLKALETIGDQTALPVVERFLKDETEYNQVSSKQNKWGNIEKETKTIRFSELAAGAASEIRKRTAAK